jgi:hypothetical protein
MRTSLSAPYFALKLAVQHRSNYGRVLALERTRYNTAHSNSRLTQFKPWGFLCPPLNENRKWLIGYV